MKTKTQFMNRILSFVLSIMMVVSMLPASTLSVFAADTTYPYAVVDTEAGTVTIDGTLGGKTDATEEDLTALVAALKSYVESGYTTIIVTGSQPAKLLKDGYLIPVVSRAFEQLTYDYQDEKIDSYWGTVDLIYQDVTEIVEYEFYVCDVLKSITLPKVTTVGDRGFWACYYLETLTFGSVVTAINDNSGEVFYDLGYEIDGCNLALNCGQLQEATEYQPNLNTNTWWKDNEWKSITLTHTEGTAATCIAQAVCSVCGESYGELGAHTAEPTYVPNAGDSTQHDATYSCCGATVTEAHTMNVTTGKCVCGADMTAIATVTDGTNTYYAADAATLNQAVTAILETGSRTFTVELPADAEAGMIIAIRRAICDTEGVADGSIHLTLKGVTTIPGTTNWDGVAFGPGDIYDEAGKIVDQELVTQLASINLPDVTEIGAQAFYFCENLVSVSAPKAQTIGAQAFGYTALTSVEFPELTTIPTDMFSGTWTLSSAKFPKVTTIEQGGLLVGAKFMPENNPTPFPLELTAEGDITFNGSNHFNIKSQNYSGKVDLVLCCDKADKVTKNEDGTATWQVRDDLSYTFKSITFKHSYVDGKCTACGEDCTHTGGEATCTEKAICEACGTSYGEVDTTNHDSSVECVNGFCPNGCYEPATLNAAGYYEIDNAGKLFWFAQEVNVKGNREIKGVLTADIDLENKPWTPIGETGENNNNFRGVFDGQGHTIKGLYVEGGRAGLGFFGEVRTGTVKNFTIYGNVVVNTEVDYVGGVIGSICGVNGETDLERNGAIIQNITSFVNVTAKAHGIGMIGGFVGYANHQSLIEQCAWYGTFDAGEYRVDSGAGGFIGHIYTNSSVTIRNCAAYGTIKTDYVKNSYNNYPTIYMGGFLSFSNTGAQTVLENCLFAGRFERGENLTDQAFLGAFGTLRSVNAIKNCYYLGDDGLEAVHSDSNLKPGSDNVEITSVTGEELRNNTIATQLGDHWMQDVHYPIPKDTKAHSDSATYTYTDNGDGTHKKTCNECGYVEEVNEAHSGGTATTYTDNGNGTHSFKCAKCDAVMDSEPHTIENHVCTACGAKEIVVSFNAGDYKWETGDQINFVREVEGIGIDDCVFTATVAEDGTVTWSADKPFCWYGEGEQKLFAAPNNGWSTDYFVVPEDQSTVAKLDEADLVNGMWVGTPTTDTITFNMTHRMAKVTVNYEFAEGITADISELKVYSIAEICLFSTDDWSIKLTSAGQFDVWVTPYLDGNQFTTFIIPETYATGEDFIKISLSNGTVYEVKMNKAVTFAEGAEYTYKVVITADGAYLTCADECSFEYTANEDGLTHSKTCSKCGYVAASENHTLTYTANGSTITESCSANCGHTGTATISATGKTYDGNAVEVVVSKTGSLENTDIPVTLTKDSEAFTGEPVNAGAYTASITLGGKTVSVNFTIAKAEVSIATAPTPNMLTYIGEAQYLISAGEAVGGTMVYSLTEDGEYTTSILQGTNAGDYKVWYYVQGDANHKDSAKDYVSVTIAKATPTAEDFIFTAPTDLIYDGTAKPATITVKDGIVGMGEVNVIYFRYAGMWIDNEREPIYPGRYKVGIWIKEGDNYKAVYSDERIWLGSEFEIKYLTTDAKADISGTMGSNGWYTSDVTLTAPEGYQISKTKYNDGFESKLIISAEKNETITYYLKDANGDVAEKTVELKIDKTAPAAQYQIGTDGWKQFINTITFGLFCKDYKTVDIEYTDDLSGVAEKQYYISREEITNTSRIAWLDYTDTLSLNATGKYFIFMRVVDNAGNEVILNTEGIVIYEDSIQVTESVSATYNAGTDKAVTVKLNGNTVNAIQNGNAVLTAGTDYTVSADGTITLKASYLDALKAGEYTFTVSYNPQGVETDKVNMTTAFTVKVEKADGKVSNINISNKTYDGTAVTAPTFDKLGDGAATIEYKLSDADDNTYTTTAPKNAGNYAVRVTVAEGTNHKETSATTYFAIASAELRDVSVQQVGTLTYTGEALTPAVSANAVAVNNQPITFTYSTELEGPYSTEIPSFTNAGWTHRVYYRATAENHNASYGSFLVEIEKATVTEPAIASKPYSGSAQTADISDTDLYTVEKNNGGTEKGSYDIVLKLKDSANYKWSTTNNAEVTLQFVISAAQNAWDTNPSISGWTYGEAAKTPDGTAKYGAVKVVYTGKANDGTDYNSETAPTKAGNYTATFTVTGTEDYSGLSEQVNFTIAKKSVTVTANDASKTYGESDPALTYTHTELVGSDALVITVARTSGENANTYTITASQAEGANPNYEITFKTGTFTIHKATLTVTVEDKTATYGDPVPTYTVKYEGFKNGDDKDDLGSALAFECGYAQFSDKGEYTIKASGYTSDNYTISYVDGKLTVNAKPITVTIQNATSVYGDTLAELKATDNGIVNGDTNVYSLATTAAGTSNVGKYTITGAALDSNYDVTFVNGEYEITKREITITVDAKNTVVNTTLPTYTYKVEGLVGVDTLVTEPTLTCNVNIALIGEYDITASGADAGGNYSIKYVPAKLTVLTDNAVDAAADYTEELKDYDPATVTSEDKAELEEMLSEINTILADETTTDNGKKALEEVKEQVEKLIKEITDAAEATDTENTEKVENVTPENVTPENKTDLEGAKADLEKALEDNGGNYTEDEKKAIEEEIKRIDDALEVIGNVEAVEEVISKLPAVDTVKPDDEEAIKAITDAQTAYNALSDYEKSLVDEATKANLDKLAAALVAYDIVEGDGSSWTEDSDHNITFVVNGLFGKFVGIKVDGKDVDKANYEVKAGSTIITLKASYLDTLAVGEHTITVVYTDGSTDGAFNVHAKANSPATGDNSNMFLWIALLFISGGAVITLTVVERKRRTI